MPPSASNSQQQGHNGNKNKNKNKNKNENKNKNKNKRDSTNHGTFQAAPSTEEPSPDGFLHAQEKRQTKKEGKLGQQSHPHCKTRPCGFTSSRQQTSDA
jgi:hypothetical protein